MENSRKCFDDETVAEGSDNNNTENSSHQGNEYVRKKELSQNFYEMNSKALDIIEQLEKDSSAKESQLLNENERLKKELEQAADPVDAEQNVIYQNPQKVNDELKVSERESKGDLVEKDEKIQSLEKEIENLLKDSDRNQRLTFVHEILKKQKEEAVENSNRLASSLHQQEIELITLQSRLGEVTEQLEKKKAEVERKGEEEEEMKKLLEDTIKENVQFRAQSDSLVKKVAMLNYEKKSEGERFAAELKRLREESNNKENKLKAENETLQNSLQESKKALKASESKAVDASSRFRKTIEAKENLVKDEQERLMKSKKEAKNLKDEFLLKEELFKEEKRKLRDLNDEYKTQIDNYHFEVRELRDKIRTLETELDSIHHLERNSDHYHDDEKVKITFNCDSEDENLESEILGISRKRRRVVEEREDYNCDSEEEKPRRSVFSRLGQKN